MSVQVALVQLDCSSAEPVASRIERAHALVAQAAADGAQVVVLPELWHVGAFDMNAARSNAESITGPLVTGLSALAKEHAIWLHGGSFCELDGDEHYNTSVVFTPDGQLAATYRKIHLFGFDGGETTLMSGGDELVVIDTPLGPTGIATCYDLRFPELFRALTAGDATVFLMCSGWPTPRIAHWDVLAQARAIEDQAWVIACNQVGTQGRLTLGGHSIVVSPTGEIVALAGSDETVLTAEIDVALPEQWRAEFPALADIRIS